MHTVSSPSKGIVTWQYPISFRVAVILRMMTVLLLLFISQRHFSQELSIKHLTSRQGLSMDYVTTLFQDCRGFIWMGTFFGLNRFDGDEVRVFRPNHLDPWSLHANRINYIIEDPHGLLWLCTDNGLAILDPWSERIVHLQTLNNQFPILNVRKAILDKKGRIWIFQEHNGLPRLLGIQTNAGIKTRIQKGKTPDNFDVATISLPENFGTGLNAFLQSSDSTAVAIDSWGTCANVHLLKKNAVKKRLEEVSLPLSANLRHIPNPTRRSGTLFAPDHDFTNGYQADQMVEYLHLPDGRTLLSFFFDKKIYVLNRFKDLQNLDAEGLREKLPIFGELAYPTTFSRLIDGNGDLWIGTTGSGVFKLSTNNAGYKQIARNTSFYNIALLPNQALWAGAFSAEAVVNLPTQQIQKAPWHDFFTPEDQVKGVLTSKNGQNIYLAINIKEKNAVQGFRLDVNTRKIEELPVRLGVLETPPLLLEDNAGNIWFSGNSGEVVRYTPKENRSSSMNVSRFFPQEIADQMTSQDLLQAKNGTLWIATNFGLIKTDKPDQAKPTFKTYHNYGKSNKIFANNGIFALCQDPKNPDILWLGTLGNGLAKFHIPSEKVSYLSQEDFSYRQIILGIVPDKQNRLWLSTDQGITCFDPVQNQFISYDLQENLQAPQFNATSFGKLENGDILFGSTQGLFVLDPSTLLKAPSGDRARKIEITKVQVNNTPINELFRQGNANIALDGQLDIALKYNQNNITVQFAAPFARNPQSLYYRYKVTGLSNQWNNIGKQRTISLPGLAPGIYRIQIQVANPGNSDQQANSTSMMIRITPPWYLSKLAYLIYSGLAAFLLVLLLRYNQKRLTEKYAAELSQQEMQRLQSIDAFKNKFFAYIAHEIKTPLSIILGIGDKLQQENKNPEQNQYLETIQYEGNNMLGLIDEIVDITRIQDGSIRLHYRHGDITAFLRNALDSYKPLADFRDIELNFQSHHAPIFADFDDQRIRHIINNLINNALQHTPSGGSITLLIQNPSLGRLQISVADTGQGIAASELPFIFEKYYQGASAAKTEHNFGLGLSYVKDLVVLMNGQVFAESTPGKGTTFTIELPLKSQASEIVPLAEQLPSNPKYLTEIENTVPALNNQNLPLLLIVEDNPMIISVLKLPLTPHFRLMTAKDGREGLNSALAEIPDLILTDVVMPVMDGLEMTRQLKSNPLTAHIPIVVLSAKSEIPDRIAGQECGADAYIGKPYHATELLLTLRNLQTLQSRWKAYYSKRSAGVSPLSGNGAGAEGLSESAISASDAFLQSLYQAFQNNYHLESFDIQQLCRLLHISKAQLYRKLNAISDQGPMEMLRDYRLDKALELLQNDPNLGTSEVAFKVGFKERTYFSTQFKKKFGIAPSMVKAAKR